LDDDEAVDVEKAEGGAKTFGAANSELKQQHVCEEIWNVTDALRGSLMSIVRDDTVGDKTALLKQSLSEFNIAALGFANQWGEGKEAEVQKHEASPIQDGEPVVKAEEDAEMKIDKSKMTAGERAFFEDIEKRYGAPEVTETDTQTNAVPAPIVDAPVQKSAAEVLKEISHNGKKCKLILRLQTSKDPEGRKNAIITFLHIRDSEWRRLLRNKKILYKRVGEV